MRTPLGFSITAHPILGVAGAVAGFNSVDSEDLLLTLDRVAGILQPHGTPLLDIVIERVQSPSVLRLRGPEG